MVRASSSKQRRERQNETNQEFHSRGKAAEAPKQKPAGSSTGGREQSRGAGPTTKRLTTIKSQKPGKRVAPREQASLPHINLQHPGRLMARQIHQLTIAPPEVGRRGYRAGPQRVRPITRSVDTNISDPPFDSLSESFTRDRPPLNNIAGLHTAEKRPIPITTESKPVPKHPNRIGASPTPSPNTQKPPFTLLIALAIPKQHSQPLGPEANIGKLQPGELRAAEARSETENDNGPIARPESGPATTPASDAHKILSRKSNLADRLLPPLAPNASDDLTSRRANRRTNAGELMPVSDRGHMPLSRRNLPAQLGEHPGDVQLESLGSGRKGRPANTKTPAIELAPVGSISLDRPASTHRTPQRIAPQLQGAHINTSTIEQPKLIGKSSSHWTRRAILTLSTNQCRMGYDARRRNRGHSL
jgi:hypothetical protein